MVFEPHCFKFIHDAAGKVFSDNKDKGIKGRSWTISNVYEHYDYNAATMQGPKNSDFNFDFSFHNYIHLLYNWVFGLRGYDHAPHDMVTLTLPR